MLPTFVLFFTLRNTVPCREALDKETAGDEGHKCNIQLVPLLETGARASWIPWLTFWGCSSAEVGLRLQQSREDLLTSFSYLLPNDSPQQVLAKAMPVSEVYSSRNMENKSRSYCYFI